MSAFALSVTSDAKPFTFPAVISIYSRSLAMIKMTVQMVSAIVVRIEMAPFMMMSSSIPENAGLKPPLLCLPFGDFTIF
jgi:hypothetical protein